MVLCNAIDSELTIHEGGPNPLDTYPHYKYATEGVRCTASRCTSTVAHPRHTIVTIGTITFEFVF